MSIPLTATSIPASERDLSSIALNGYDCASEFAPDPRKMAISANPCHRWSYCVIAVCWRTLQYFRQPERPSWGAAPQFSVFARRVSRAAAFLAIGQWRTAPPRVRRDSSGTVPDCIPPPSAAALIAGRTPRAEVSGTTPSPGAVVRRVVRRSGRPTSRCLPAGRRSLNVHVVDRRRSRSGRCGGILGRRVGFADVVPRRRRGGPRRPSHRRSARARADAPAAAMFAVSVR
jgi:hypothetical protein